MDGVGYLIQSHRLDWMGSGCTQAVNYSKPSTFSYLKSTEKGEWGVLNTPVKLHTCGKGHGNSLPPPPLPLPPSPHSHHFDTAALEGFSPIKHQGMRSSDRSLRSSNTQQMCNGLIDPPEKWRARGCEVEERSSAKKMGVKIRLGQMSIYIGEYELTCTCTSLI